MPLVKATIQAEAGDEDAFESYLFTACREIIPSGLNSPQGKLTPGSIEFMPVRLPVGHDLWLTTDVVLDIEAYHYEDRENLEERAENIRRALKNVFPRLTFAVWLKLVNAGWASDSVDPDFDGDMSMGAAIERVFETVPNVICYNQ